MIEQTRGNERDENRGEEEEQRGNLDSYVIFKL